MEIIECKCEDCRARFIIEKKKPFPPWKIVCPVCESKCVTIHKIDGDGCY